MTLAFLADRSVTSSHHAAWPHCGNSGRLADGSASRPYCAGAAAGLPDPDRSLQQAPLRTIGEPSVSEGTSLYGRRKPPTRRQVAIILAFQSVVFAALLALAVYGIASSLHTRSLEKPIPGGVTTTGTVIGVRNVPSKYGLRLRPGSPVRSLPGDLLPGNRAHEFRVSDRRRTRFGLLTSE